MSEANARITLERLPRPRSDLGRTYQVLIDGAVVGGIRRKETKTFQVAPGPHQIQLKLDWCTSRAVAIELPPGAEAKLMCRARPPDSGWRVLASSNYIELQIVDAVMASASAFGQPTSSPQPTKPEPPPGAPDDAELAAAWERRSNASAQIASLRRNLQSAIEAGDSAEADRLKHEVHDVLAEHHRLTAEYTKLKELRRNA